MKSRPSRAALLGALAGALCLAGCGNDAKNQTTQSTQQRDPEMAKPAGYQGHNGTVRDIPESKPFTPGPDYQAPPPLPVMQQGGAQAGLVQTGSGAMAPLAGSGQVGAVGGSGAQTATMTGQGVGGGADAQNQAGRSAAQARPAAGGTPAQGKAAPGAKKK